MAFCIFLVDYLHQLYHYLTKAVRGNEPYKSFVSKSQNNNKRFKNIFPRQTKKKKKNTWAE